MLRCFAISYIVQDTQPGWFSNVLVRTHLIIATRLTSNEASIPLRDRLNLPSADWIQVSPEAANKVSLVGTAFREEKPEASFSSWLNDKSPEQHMGIHRQAFSLFQEWANLENRINSKRWFLRLEGPKTGLPLFTQGRPSLPVSLPDIVRDIIPHKSLNSLSTLEEIGIQVGQGLRTGCNQFFYVTIVDRDDNEMVKVRSSSLFNNHEFSVPASVLRSVLRRQSEITFLQKGGIPPGRVLDLRGWVLPEDAETVRSAASIYKAIRETMPKIMPEELSTFVRNAGQFSQEGNVKSKRIPDLSAVRTNIRIPRNDTGTPRFWYMLPDFTPRHLPAVFVPRINNGRLWAECNSDPPILIDANFSTFWSKDGSWTKFALKAILNSTWCYVLSEALGTPMGGGALKLEASHFRQMPFPKLSKKAQTALDLAGRDLNTDTTSAQSIIDVTILGAIIGEESNESRLLELAGILASRANKLNRERQRVSL
jgi:hypothetical protein